MTRTLVRTLASTAVLAGFAALLLGSTGAEVEVDDGAGTTGAAEPTAAHCDAIEGMSTCVQYASKADAEGDCNSFGGTVADGACPSEGLSGSCAHDGKVRKYYTTGEMPNDADYASKHCKNAMAGTFTPAE